jgi:hypothetical protein
MIKLRNFWRVFTKSISSISYYKDIAVAKFGFSLKYLYFLLLILAFLQGIVSAVKLSYLLPKIPQFIEDARYQVSNFYPKELVLTVKDQKISSNVKEPYVIRDFVVIDTKISAADLATYKDKVILGDSFVAIPDSQNGGNRTISLTDYLKNVPNGTQFTQKSYLDLAGKLLPYLNYLPTVIYCLIAAVLVVWPFIGAGLVLLGRMIILVFSTLALLILAAIMKRDLGYGKIFQLSLHALTIPVVLTFVSGYFSIPYLGLINSIIFLAYMIPVIASMELKPSARPSV